MAANDSDFEATVRRFVREELQSFGGSGVQSLLNRTRSLINSAASSSAAAINLSGGEVRPPRPNLMLSASALPQSSGTLQGSQRRFPNFRSVPGHPYRPLKKKVVCKKAAGVPKGVYLLDFKVEGDDDFEDSNDAEPQCTFSESLVILKGEFDLTPGDSEEKIRQDLCEVFKTKFPEIAVDDFTFIKRDRNSLVKPAVKKNHKWDFLHVKSLVGQGRLYVQLKAPSSEIIRRASISEDELHEPAFGSVLPISDLNQDIRSWAVHTSNEPAASSSGINEPASNINSQISTLRGIFPYAVQSDLELAISREGSISGAVDLLLNNKNISSESAHNEPPKTIKELLKDVQKQFKEDRFKLRVDEEDFFFFIIQ